MKNYKDIYVLGIGGAGMSSIAKYLVQKGHNVKGYDQRKSFLTNQLEQDGVKVEFEKEKLNYSEATLYIYSSAINLEDKHLNIYKNKNNVISRPEFLTELSRESKIIGITGTHGKTSTTALLAHIFHYNNIDVSYIFGGSTSYSGIGGHFGGPDQPLVLETDEAFNTFKNIEINDLLVTNIDADHLDYFKSFENLKEAFIHVINKVKNNIVLNYDDEHLKKINPTSNCLTYSSKEETTFKIIYPNKFVFDNIKYEIITNLIGSHFISNIVGAICLANLNGISIENSLKAIETFPGVKRRIEYLGSVQGVNIYDDYGHHPTEIKATINALKQNTSGNLFVIFQPHRYTRTKNNFEEFKNVLKIADQVIVIDIYPAGEMVIPGVTSKNFEDVNIKYLKSMRMVPSFLSRRVNKNDTILTIGAGDITLLGPEIIKYLDE